MGEQGPGIWRFDGVELDERLAVLRVDDTVVALDRSSYDVLLALLRSSGEVVTKDELLQAGWPGRIVSENSLAKAVSRLRQALGASAGALRVVHGYGYRLAADVRRQQAEGQSAPAPDVAHLHEGDVLAQRPGWQLVRRAGTGTGNATWLARDATGEQRAIRFATGEEGLRRLKREVERARYLGSVRPGYQVVAPVLGWNLRTAPFFIELPWYDDGHLSAWAQGRGRLVERTAAERIALCAALCDAVAMLHQAGLVHRGLCPETVYPIPHEDVAGGWRMLLGDLGAEGHAAGNSPWTAPEVVAGQIATQRSDVFALGVLVFQLLVGDLRRTLVPGWESDVGDALLCEDIRAAATANPATRTIDARELANRLRTLQSRHAALAEREAQAKREAERARMAARDRTRRRLLWAVSGALALGLAGTSTMYAAAEGARRDAERKAAQHRAVLDFVTEDILAQADPYRNAQADAELTLVDAVDRAAEGVSATVTDPASAAAVHAMVAAVYFAHDRHADAIEQFDRARALYRSLQGATATPTELVAVETGLCDVHRIAGDLARAQDACLSAHALASASDSKADRDLATLKLGQLRGEQGLDDAALDLLKPLLAADAFAGTPGLRGELHWAMGLSERGLGRYPAARRHFEAMLALQPDDAMPGTWTAWGYNSLGSVQVSIGDYDAAEATLVEARRIFTATQGAGQVEAQMPNIWRGEIRLRRGQWEEAAAFQQALLEAWGGVLEPAHPLLLKARANLAWAWGEAGDAAQARHLLDEALRERAIVFDRPGDEVAVRAMRWARAALALRDDAAVDTLLDIVDASLAREFPEAHPVRAEVECLHAQRAIQRGLPAQAAPRARACGEMLAAFVDARHPLVAESRALLSATGTAPVAASSTRARD